MTSLEFIKREIKNQKETIDIAKEYIKAGILIFPAEKINKENLKCMEEQLKTLQQIKTDLEAWEVVKLKEVDLYDVIHTTNYKQYKSENVDLLKEYFLTQQEYEIIKRALEVDDA